MKIRDYDQDHLRKRLAAAECLLLYDPEGRFRPLDLDLEPAGGECALVNTSASSIHGRAEAMAAWLALGDAAKGTKHLLTKVDCFRADASLQ